MNLNAGTLNRYRAVAKLLMKYGRTTVRSRFQSEGAADTTHDNKGADLTDELEKLGPTFIKLGQLLSSRTDLLPERYLKHLSRLQDRVKPFSFQEVQDTVEAELGVKINKAFSCFEPEPIAAASL